MVSVSIVGSDYFLSMGVFVCVLVSECLRRRCCQPARPRPSPPPHARRPPSYLHDCSLVHWETSRWCHSCVNIAMATPLFPLPTMPHTHTEQSHSSTPTQPQDTHTHACVRNSLDCIRCRTNLIHMPRQPSLKTPFMVQVSFSQLWVRSAATTLLFFPLSITLWGKKETLPHCSHACDGPMKGISQLNGTQMTSRHCFYLAKSARRPGDRGGTVHTYRALPVCRHLFWTALFCVNMTARC